MMSLAEWQVAPRKPVALKAEPLRVLVLGSFPPRECGIATFTKDVVDSLGLRTDVRCEVIAIDEPGTARRYEQPVVARLARDDTSSYAELAGFINAHPAELLLVQHEYGLFGLDDGAAFVALLRAIRKPAVVTFHTVLAHPSEHHRDVTQQICAIAQMIVVLSNTAKDIVLREYRIAPDRVRVIAHGVPDVPFAITAGAKQRLAIADRTVISTFGLLSCGKGLEDAIEAMRSVVLTHPEALYLILGQTHPLVRQHEGETYRMSLRELVVSAGLERHVQFVDRYLTFEDLVSYLSATDIYVTPYLNAEQIVSGTLAYAVGCGKAIVSTPYLYAKELLADERGVLCGFRDPPSIAAAILMLLDNPLRRRSLERRAYAYGRTMIWPHVAEAYAGAFREVVSNLESRRSSLPLMRSVGVAGR